MNYNEYSENWRDVIRPAILRRDNYKCQHCGVVHRARGYWNSRSAFVVCDDFQQEWALSTGRKLVNVYLNVAHLDQNKQNNDPANLLSLCPKCHSKFDAKFKSFARVKFAEKISANTGSTHQKDFHFPFLELKSFIKENYAVTLSVGELQGIVQFIKSKL